MKTIRKILYLAAAASIMSAVALTHAAPAAAEVDAKAVLATHSSIALAMYEDALGEAKKLQQAVDALIANPTADTLAAARSAWKAARVPYQQTEGLRFGNNIVDDWEGRVNAWPLDEGLIDYVDAGYGESSDENPLYTANVIANTSLRIGKTKVDAAKITKALLSKTLHEAGEVESNVATGYHAIEFLLWGQDYNGTNAGSGARPATDYATKSCTNGHCDRRAAYLKAATDLLVDDLTEMVGDWKPGGKARKAADKAGVAGILTGLGSLSYGELAGERIKLGLLLHDPEEEHDCFSDNTHNSHYYDQVGMVALYSGKYTRTNGDVVSGPSLTELAMAKSPDTAAALTKNMDNALARLRAVKDKADSGAMAYDQMIGSGNAEGNKLIQDVVDGLVTQARSVEAVAAGLGIKKLSIEGSDSLDDPDKALKGG